VPGKTTAAAVSSWQSAAMARVRWGELMGARTTRSSRFFGIHSDVGGRGERGLHQGAAPVFGTAVVGSDGADEVTLGLVGDQPWAGLWRAAEEGGQVWSAPPPRDLDGRQLLADAAGDHVRRSGVPVQDHEVPSRRRINWQFTTADARRVLGYKQSAMHGSEH